MEGPPADDMAVQDLLQSDRVGERGGRQRFPDSVFVPLGLQLVHQVRSEGVHEVEGGGQQGLEHLVRHGLGLVLRRTGVRAGDFVGCLPGEGPQALAVAVGGEQLAILQQTQDDGGDELVDALSVRGLRAVGAVC